MEKDFLVQAVAKQTEADPLFLHDASAEAPGFAYVLARMQSLELALDCLGQALIVLGRNGKISYATPHAQGILDAADGLETLAGALHASLAEDRQSLTASLDAASRHASPGGAKSELMIRRPSGKLPYKLRIHALQQAEATAQQGLLVMIHDTHANHLAWYDRLQARFQLTPRECEVTMLLTDGYSMAEIAERMGISMQTLRQHLKHAFNKTETHKQHELVGIVLQMLRKR